MSLNRVVKNKHEFTQFTIQIGDAEDDFRSDIKDSIGGGSYRQLFTNPETGEFNQGPLVSIEPERYPCAMCVTFSIRILKYITRPQHPEKIIEKATVQRYVTPFFRNEAKKLVYPNKKSEWMGLRILRNGPELLNCLNNRYIDNGDENIFSNIGLIKKQLGHGVFTFPLFCAHMMVVKNLTPTNFQYPPENAGWVASGNYWEFIIFDAQEARELVYAGKKDKHPKKEEKPVFVEKVKLSANVLSDWNSLMKDYKITIT